MIYSEATGSSNSAHEPIKSCGNQGETMLGNESKRMTLNWKFPKLQLAKLTVRITFF